MSNAVAYAVGAKYTFGDYTVGLAIEKLTGYISSDNHRRPSLDVATPDNTDAKHVVLSVSARLPA